MTQGIGTPSIYILQAMNPRLGIGKKNLSCNSKRGYDLKREFALGLARINEEQEAWAQNISQLFSHGKWVRHLHHDQLIMFRNAI